MSKQGFKTSFAPYFSAICFAAIYAAGPPCTYTLKKGTKSKAFSYGEGKSMVSAGFPATYNGDGTASFTETNIIDPGRTISGQMVDIRGLAVSFGPMSPPELVKRVLQHCHATLKLNGNNTVAELGPIPFMPGGGGLFGAAPGLREPAFDGTRELSGALSNGMPGRDNFLPIREGVQWNPQDEDSLLSIEFEITSDIVVSVNPIAAVAPNQANIIPVKAYVPPVQDAEESLVTMWVKLIGDVSGPRSNVV